MAVSTSTLYLVLRATNLTGPAFSGVQAGLARIGVAAAVGLAGAGAAAVKMAADFQGTMLQTAALTGQTASQVGASSAQMSQGFTGTSAAVLKLATQIPVSAQNLAEGLYFITSSGFQAADAMNILTLSGKDAAIGHMDTKVAADALTSALNAYGVGADQAANFNDTLLQTVNLGKAEFDDLGRSVSSILPISAQAGVSFQQVGAAIATMTLTGMTARTATMDLRRLLTEVTTPTKGSANLAKMLGLDLSKGNLEKVGLKGIVQEAMTATGGNMDLMKTLFPNQAGLQAIRILSQDMGNFSHNLDVMGKGTTNGAVTAQAFATTMQGATAQLKLLNTTIGAVGTEIGGVLLPPIVRLAQFGAGILLPVLSGLARVLIVLQNPLGALGAVAGPVGRELLVLASAAAALGGRLLVLLSPLTTMGRSVQLNGQFMGRLGTAVALIVGPLLALRAVTLAFTLAQAALSLVTGGVVRALGLQVLWHGIHTAALKVAQGATMLFTLAQGALNLVMSANPIALIVLALAGLVAGVLYAYNTVKPFHDLVNGLWTMLKNDLGPVLVQLGSWFRDTLGGAVDFVVQKIQGLLSFLGQVLDAASHIPGLGVSVPQAEAAVARTKAGHAAAQSAATNHLQYGPPMPAALIAQHAEAAHKVAAAAGTTHLTARQQAAENAVSGATRALQAAEHKAATEAAKENTKQQRDLAAQLKLLTDQYKATGDPATLAKYTALDTKKLVGTGIDAGLAAQLASAEAGKLHPALAHAAKSAVLAAPLPTFGGASASGAGAASQGQTVISFAGAQQASNREQARQMAQQLAALQQQLVVEKEKNGTLLAQIAGLLGQIAGHGATTAQATQRTAAATSKPAQSLASLLRPAGVGLLSR